MTVRSKDDEAVLDVICGMYAPGGPLCPDQKDSEFETLDDVLAEIEDEMKYYLAPTVRDALAGKWIEVSKELYEGAARVAGIANVTLDWTNNRRSLKWQAGKVYSETERVQP